MPVFLVNIKYQKEQDVYVQAEDATQAKRYVEKHLHDYEEPKEADTMVVVDLEFETPNDIPIRPTPAVDVAYGEEE